MLGLLFIHRLQGGIHPPPHPHPQRCCWAFIIYSLCTIFPSATWWWFQTLNISYIKGVRVPVKMPCIKLNCPLGKPGTTVQGCVPSPMGNQSIVWLTYTTLWSYVKGPVVTRGISSEAILKSCYIAQAGHIFYIAF